MSEKMQFIEVTETARTTFGNFFAGELRKVPADVAGFLISTGWAQAVDANEPANQPKANAESVTLDVQNAGLGVKSEDAG